MVSEKAPLERLAFTAEEAAIVIGVTYDKFCFFVRQGLITGIKVGSGSIYSKNELQRFLDDNIGKRLSNSDHCKIAMIQKNKELTSSRR